MDILKTALQSATGEISGTYEWPKEILGPSPSRRVLHEVVMAYQANLRSGTSATKTRGLVSGGGRKPWKQKGTGNARSGSIRSPLWRKGGIIFGPQPRSYRQGVGPVKKIIALQTALLEKAQASELSVIEPFGAKKTKTRDVSKIMDIATSGAKSLLVVSASDRSLHRSVRNLRNVTVVDATEVNAWSIISSHKVLFTKPAVDALVNRFPKG